MSSTFRAAGTAAPQASISAAIDCRLFEPNEPLDELAESALSDQKTRRSAWPAALGTARRTCLVRSAEMIELRTSISCRRRNPPSPQIARMTASTIEPCKSAPARPLSQQPCSTEIATATPGPLLFRCTDPSKPLLTVATSR